MSIGLGGDDSDSESQFEYLTPFYREMEIATEYLHGSHESFKKLPRMERLKLLLFDEMKRKREQYFLLKQKQEMDKARVKGIPAKRSIR